ncbi:MAG: hypothetical protein JW967_02730 [Dehalococcoidales bacterium]|nr:hypothetical protein [Dehalococcoidales bacterium]
MNRQKRIFYYLLIVLVALVVADGIITRTLIINNMAIESNPFLVEWVGSDLLLILKLSGAGLAAVILWQISQRKPRVSLAVTSIFVAFYIGILFWNLFVYFTAYI